MNLKANSSGYIHSTKFHQGGYQKKKPIFGKKFQFQNSQITQWKKQPSLKWREKEKENNKNYLNYDQTINKNELELKDNLQKDSYSFSLEKESFEYHKNNYEENKNTENGNNYVDNKINLSIDNTNKTTTENNYEMNNNDTNNNSTFNTNENTLENESDSNSNSNTCSVNNDNLNNNSNINLNNSLPKDNNQNLDKESNTDNSSEQSNSNNNQDAKEASKLGSKLETPKAKKKKNKKHGTSTKKKTLEYKRTNSAKLSSSSSSTATKDSSNKKLENNVLSQPYNKFNSSNQELNVMPLINPIAENTAILTVKVKLAKDKTVLFKIRRFDDLFLTVKLFCEINNIQEKLMKPIITKVLCTLNSIYQCCNTELDKKNIRVLQMLNAINTDNEICNDNFMENENFFNN